MNLSSYSADALGQISTLDTLSHFSLKGKASFVEKLGSNRPGELNNRFYTAALNWDQQQDNFEIRLTGPVNQGYIIIEGDQRQASAQDSHGQQYGPHPPAQLLAQLTGVKIPLAYLTDWVTGRSSPKNAVTNWHTQTLSDGTVLPHSLEQSGWTITLDRWQQWAGHWLPEKVTASKKNQKVKIFIYEWSNLPAKTEVISHDS